MLAVLVFWATMLLGGSVGVSTLSPVTCVASTSGQLYVESKYNIAVRQCEMATQRQLAGKQLYRWMRNAFRKWGNAYASQVAATQIACTGFGTQFECVMATSIAQATSADEAATQAAALLTVFETLADCAPVGATSPYSSEFLAKTLGEMVTRVSAQVDASVCVGPGSTASVVGYVDCLSRRLGRAVAKVAASAMLERGCVRGRRGQQLRDAAMKDVAPICACMGWVATTVAGQNVTAQVSISGSCDNTDGGSLAITPQCGALIEASQQTDLQALALNLTATSVTSACGYAGSADAMYSSVKAVMEDWGTALAQAAVSVQSACALSAALDASQCTTASLAVQSLVEMQSSVLAIGVAAAINECPACDALAAVDVQSVALSVEKTVTAANAYIQTSVCVGSDSFAQSDGYVECYARTVARGISKVVLDTMIQGGCFAAEQSAELVAEADVYAVTQIDTIGFCACLGWQIVVLDGQEFFAQTNITASCLT